MNLSKFWLLAILVTIVASFAIMFACDDDDDDDEDADDDGSPDDDDNDTADDDDDDNDDNDDTSPVPGTIAGTVTDFLSENALAGMDVEAFQADTGLPFDPPITGVSGANGKVTLELPGSYTQATVGIKVSGTQGALVYKDTIQFGFLVGATNETFLGISQTVFNLMAGSLPTPPEADKGHVAGAVYWGNPSDETPVGCAEVTVDPVAGSNVYYASGILGLPGTDRDITTPGDPQNGEGTDPNENRGKGVFVAVNVDPAIATAGVTITANADGNEESAFLPIVLADSVLIQNVYFDKGEYATNPTGAWCTSK
jgi:hypothetical protein